MLQNFSENTRPAYVVIMRARRAFLQNFHPDPVPLPLDMHGRVFRVFSASRSITCSVSSSYFHSEYV
jgi:hypothetical protein